MQYFRHVEFPRRGLPVVQDVDCSTKQEYCQYSCCQSDYADANNHLWTYNQPTASVCCRVCIVYKYTTRIHLEQLALHDMYICRTRTPVHPPSLCANRHGGHITLYGCTFTQQVSMVNCIEVLPQTQLKYFVGHVANQKQHTQQGQHQIITHIKYVCIYLCQCPSACPWGASLQGLEVGAVLLLVLVLVGDLGQSPPHESVMRWGRWTLNGEITQ